MHDDEIHELDEVPEMIAEVNVTLSPYSLPCCIRRALAYNINI